jgi:rSAM/selenodomain-associated transferase 2
MRVSIIVPTLNEQTRISTTLRKLLQLAGGKEIAVVDGGSKDRTLELARAEGVRTINAPRGRGPQMHAGVMETTGDVLWFVHADTIPPSEALEDIRTALADPEVVGGNFGLLFGGPSRAARQLTAIYPSLRRLGLCYGDSGMFVRREVYEKIGGFRPLPLFEDLDLLRRLRRAGRFVHLPQRMVTSSRRFENENFIVVWLQWTALQVLYWCGISPHILARWYRHMR